MKNKMQKGVRVKVVCSIDDSNPAQHVGEIGTVIKPGDGLTVEGMISVKMDNGYQDAYWPEELEITGG